MVNQQVLTGKWNEIQGKLRDRWGQLTDDELKQFSGNAQQLVGLIQRKTGDARDKIEAYLEQLTNGTAIRQAAETVKDHAQQFVEQAGEYAEQVGTTVRDGMKSVSDSARSGYVETERLVRRRPVESLAVCFGAGLFAGVVVGLVLRSK